MYSRIQGSAYGYRLIELISCLLFFFPNDGGLSFFHLIVGDIFTFGILGGGRGDKVAHLFSITRAKAAPLRNNFFHVMGLSFSSNFMVSHT